MTSQHFGNENLMAVAFQEVFTVREGGFKSPP